MEVFFDILIYFSINLLLSYFTNPFGYAFITNIIGATAIFCFFFCIDIGSRRILNKISNSTFDVYFIHSDINTSNLLIGKLLKGYLFINSPVMIIHMIFTIIIIWILGFIACILRTKIFQVSIDHILDKILIINHVFDLNNQNDDV